LSAANVLFIYSAVGSRGEAQQGAWGRSLQKLEHLKNTQPEIKGQVKMKGII